MAPRYTLEQKTQAIALAAGGSAHAAGVQLGIEPRAVQRWIAEADPAELSVLITEKRSRVTRIVLEHAEAVATGIMEDLKTVGLDDKAAKALQARATTLGIMDDHYGGRQHAGDQTGRYGRPSDPRLQQIGERILDRLEQPGQG